MGFEIYLKKRKKNEGENFVERKEKNRGCDQSFCIRCFIHALLKFCIMPSIFLNAITTFPFTLPEAQFGFEEEGIWVFRKFFVSLFLLFLDYVTCRRGTETFSCSLDLIFCFFFFRWFEYIFSFVFMSRFRLTKGKFLFLRTVILFEIFKFEYLF